MAPSGKLDFHACRLAYINFVIESGATVKEAQALARHATPEMTMNVYGRVRQERLAATVDKIAERLKNGGKGVPGLYLKAVGAETESATPFDSRGLRFKKMVEAAGLEPRSRCSWDGNHIDSTGPRTAQSKAFQSVGEFAHWYPRTYPRTTRTTRTQICAQETCTQHVPESAPP
jgi:hypothetical protein